MLALMSCQTYLDMSEDDLDAFMTSLGVIKSSIEKQILFRETNILLFIL